MPRVILTIALLIAPLFLGCGWRKPSPPPAVKLSIECPGAAPSEVESLVCVPVRQRIIGMDGISAITCVSSTGLADIYVQGESNVDGAIFASEVDSRAQLTVPMLPVDAKLRKIKCVSSESIVAATEVHEVDVQDVFVHRDKVASLGVSIKTITTAIKNAKDSGESLDRATLETVDGKKVLLTDVAEIKTVREPDRRVLYWPATEKK